MVKTKNHSPSAREKKLNCNNGKLCDIRANYEVFFPIYSEEKGKRLCSLVKRKFSMPKYFEEDVLIDIGLKNTINSFSES